MGQPHDPTRSSESSDDQGRSASDDYRGDLKQFYPPLGYTPDGTPRFWPGAAPPRRGTRRGQEAITSTPDEASASPTSTSTAATPASSRSASSVPSVRSTAFTVVALLAAVVVVLLVAVAFFRDDPDSDTTAADQPTFTAEYPTRVPTLNPRSTPRPSGVPTRPRSPSGIDPSGHEVVYQVTIEGTGTILYVDSLGLRTEFSPPATWRIAFTGGYNPLRLIVVVGSGSSATCTITVDGETIVSDEVSPSSTKRSASCIA